MSALREAMSHAVLGWVKPELDETLRQVREQLEAFGEDPTDTSRMRFCAGYLHQVQGTLRMVELYAPAMVAEELELLAQALQVGKALDRDEACAVLMRGAVLLPDYLERLQDGHRDIPIVLLPLLNEIRAARGAAGLNESMLFPPGMQDDAPAPSEEEIDHARGSLSGRNRELLDTVGNAVKEELMRVKDALDLHLRTSEPAASLQNQVDELGNVADTLGMMGLGVARDVVQQQRDALRSVVDGSRPADEGTLLDIAGALLYVDASLDDQVARLGHPSGGKGDDTAAVDAQRTVEVLAQEAIINFALARERFVAFIETNWDHAELKDVPRLLEEVSGALRILDLGQAADYLIGVRRYVGTELIDKRRVPGGQQLDTLADAMASLEYYLEALRERRPNREEILEITRTSLENLRYWPLPDENAQAAPVPVAVAAPAATVADVPVVAETEAVAVTEAPASDFDTFASATASDDTVVSSDRSFSFDPVNFEEDGNAEVPTTIAPINFGDEIESPSVETEQEAAPVFQEPAVVAAVAPAPPPAAAPAPTVVGAVPGGFDSDAGDIDDEIREVFLEEFDEEIVNLRELLPGWRAVPDDLERLRSIRRVFHTLKGSGRLVGARVLGEFSWKIENMLNRVLDRTRPSSDAVVALLQQACDTLPQLNAALRGRDELTADIEGLKAIADRVSAGEDVYYTAETVAQPVPEAPQAPVAEAEPVAFVNAPAVVEEEGTPASVDAVLREILEVEIDNHLDTVDAWLQRAQAEPVAVDEKLLRALHTMNGALAMADVPEITGVTQPAEQYVKRMLASGHTPDREGVTALADTAQAIRRSVAALQAPSPRIPAFAALAAQLHALRDSLPDARPVLVEIVDDTAQSSYPLTSPFAGEPPMPELKAHDLSAYIDRPEETAVAGPYESTSDIGTESHDAAAPAEETAPGISAEAETEETVEAADVPAPVAEEAVAQEAAANSGVTYFDVVYTIGPRHRDVAVASPGAAEEVAPVAEEATSDVAADETERTADAEAGDTIEAEELTAEAPLSADTPEDAPVSAAADEETLSQPETTPEDPLIELSLDGGGIEDEAPALEENGIEAGLSLEEDADGEEPAIEDEALAIETDPAASVEEVAPGDLSGSIETSAEPIAVADEPAPEYIETAETAEAADTVEAGSGEEAVSELGEEASAVAIEAAEEAAEAPAGTGIESGMAEASNDEYAADAIEPAEIDISGADASEAEPEPLSDAPAEAPAAVIETPADIGSELEAEPATEIDADVEAEAETEAETETETVLEDQPDGEALDVTGLDLDLVDIFVEEGNDLLDHSDGQVAKLREAPDDRSFVSSLQRDLHTLKGGARMAGIHAIGDLGHAIESMLESIAANRTELDVKGIQLLERGFDELHGMVKRVSNRRAVHKQDQLIAQFNAHARGIELPAEQPADAADEAAPAVVLAPLSAPVETEFVQDDEFFPKVQHEQVRVRAELLDRLVNHAGEVAIYRARLEQQLGAFRGAMAELDRTNIRLHDQLRRLDLETEAQIVARYQREHEKQDPTFDPLELDRFSTLQQLSRALAESAADISGLQGVLDDLSRQYDILLQQQSRVSSELQDGLMRARMVPFEGIVPRLRRVLRQAAQDTGKQARLVLEGTHGEMDRSVLERMTAPLEHLLRNSIAHGLETPEARRAAGKPEEGTVRVVLRREGSEMVLLVSDDGAGLNRDAIRRRAEQRGLLQPGIALSDIDLERLILEPGFSTSDSVSQLSGRGVGMDVVYNEVRQLGGSLEIDSRPQQGATFTLRLPQTLAVTQAVFVQIGETQFSVPVAAVSGIGRIGRERFEAGTGAYHYAGEDYTLYNLGTLVGHAPARAEGQPQVPLLLVRAGELRAAVAVDQVLGNREIVVKAVGPQIASLPGIYGATITGDGSVVVILDVAPLVRRHLAQPEQPASPAQTIETRRVPQVMVVDDSLTMRKVTGRVLERHNFEVVTARDGIEALERLEETVPDLMLLDIEMPRMDGYELATAMKADIRFKDVPIVMITSRTGDKHRQRAFDIGVQRYMGKPYQELDLMRNVYDLLGIARARE